MTRNLLSQSNFHYQDVTYLFFNTLSSIHPIEEKHVASPSSSTKPGEVWVYKKPKKLGTKKTVDLALGSISFLLYVLFVIVTTLLVMTFIQEAAKGY
jgi:hypothetical protein